MAAGPLQGVRVVELAGIGPAPFACMLLADMGADVVRVDRPASAASAALAALGGGGAPPADLLVRGRRSVAVDLKQPAGTEVVRRLAATADVLVEGFRPGVAERLGVGPAACRANNPALVYGRMTGWGQDGPLAARAGHDLDYLAVAGALHPIGPADAPPPVPLNLIADFGGGGAFLAFGVACALVERGRSGLGQVVDAAMVDGVAALSAMAHGMLAAGLWSDRREDNLLDGAAPFYRCYTTADGRYVAVGALEPQFYAALCTGLGLDPAEHPQGARDRWPATAAAFAARFAQRPRDAWDAVFAGTDACVAPVLSLREATEHPHLVARGTFVLADGVVQPAPAPRFSRSAPAVPAPPPLPGQHTDEVLTQAGYAPDAVRQLRADGAVA